MRFISRREVLGGTASLFGVGAQAQTPNLNILRMNSRRNSGPTGITGLVSYFNTKLGPLFQNSNGSTPSIANNAPVGYWADQKGARNLLQATSGARPSLQTANPSVAFNGTSGVITASLGLSLTSGSVVVLFNTGAVAPGAQGVQAILSVADPALNNSWLEFGVHSSGFPYVELNNAGTKRTVIGSTYLLPSTAYLLEIVYDGVDWYMVANGVEQNPLAAINEGAFGWFSNVSGSPNLSLGGTVTSAGLQRPFNGQIMMAAIYSTDLTA